MINLLPTDVKKSISYARRNIILRRWATGLLVSMLGVGAIVASGFLYINHTINATSFANESIRSNLNAQNLDQTESQAKAISNNLKLVVQVLSREVLFSKLMQQIARVIPANAELTGLQITKTDGAIDLTAKSSNYNSATQVQLNLADPANKIFDKADITNIDCGKADLTDPKHPCQVTIRAQFAKNNPFLFINGNKQ